MKKYDDKFHKEQRYREFNGHLYILILLIIFGNDRLSRQYKFINLIPFASSAVYNLFTEFNENKEKMVKKKSGRTLNPADAHRKLLIIIFLIFVIHND